MGPLFVISFLFGVGFIFGHLLTKNSWRAKLVREQQDMQALVKYTQGLVNEVERLK